jgi:hypothetical protein
MTSISMILYVKAGCPWCRLAEAYLNKRGYKYERTDVREDPRRLPNLSESRAVLHADACHRRFGPAPIFGLDELEDFLKQHNILP